ncbi:hypothetical protein [Ralstonia solanacearum]|uniref:hypothetical protein n=1 Tax=Ralstonia solanacearum TaxID=305 RepID=UPI0005ACC5E1|nr:hypothetical protein [Ralstonia solanacearum]
MHKLSSVVLAAYVVAVERVRKAFSAASVSLHALLVQWHLNNLRALVKNAEDRAERFLELKHYHYTQAYEAQSLANEAYVHAAAVNEQAMQEAIRVGTTVEQA